jgi:hypothetical protein
VFPGGRDESQAPLSSHLSTLSPEQSIQRWIELVRQGAPLEQIQEAEYEVAQHLRQQPFRIKKQIPHFLKQAKKLAASKAFREIRLRDRVIQDRREQFRGEPKKAAEEAVKEEAKRAAAELQVKEGKLVQPRERPWVTAERGLAREGLEQRAATERFEKLLTAFEKMVLARFEKGKEIEKRCPEGKARFAGKTAKEWSQFFRSFLHRTVKRRALLSEIRDFLFRGLVTKGGKNIFIGDMRMASGRVEKFVRFSILAEALAKFRGMLPGDAFGKGLLGKLTGEELLYLALAATRREYEFARQPEPGRFMGVRAEAEAARALGIPLDEQLRQKARHLRGRRGKGMFGALLEEEEGPPEEIPYRFVPWWHWGNLTRPGKFRWATVVFYGSLLAIALLGIALMTYRLLGG